MIKPINKYKFVTNELIALARSRRPERRSWHSAKQSILLAASYLRKEAGENSLPIRLEGIEKLRMITKEETYKPQDTLDAILVPVLGGFLLRLNSNLTSSRQRFSIAHEIGHTFFYNFSYNPPVRILSRESSRLLIDKEEDICNAFARELLMPREFVERDLDEHNNRDLELILTLASKYRVSAEVTARRLILDLSEYDKTVLIFAEKSSGRKNQNKNIWWYYGKTLKRYIRKDEDAIFRQVLSVISDQRSENILEKIAELLSDEAMLQWYESKPDSRLMVLLSFYR